MVKVKKTEPLAQLNIKIAPALRRAVEKAALAEERSISNFAQKVLGACTVHPRMPRFAHGIGGELSFGCATGDLKRDRHNCLEFIDVGDIIVVEEVSTVTLLAAMIERNKSAFDVSAEPSPVAAPE